MENLPGLLLDTDLFNSPFFKNFIVPSICSSIFSISDAFDVEGGMPFIPFKSPLVQTGSFSLFSKFSARLTFPAFFRLSFFLRFSCSRFFRISIIAVNSLHSYIQFYKTAYPRVFETVTKMSGMLCRNVRYADTLTVRARFP